MFISAPKFKIGADFMKYIITVLSIVLAGILFTSDLNAQSIEQISYVPVKKGNYSNLLVKKRTIIGGNLEVTNQLVSHSTILYMTARTKATFVNAATLNVNHDVLLTGTEANITDLYVNQNNVLSVLAPKTKISLISGLKNIYATALTANGTGGAGFIRRLFVDGVEIPNTCTFKWDSVTTAEGGNFTVLTCL